MRILTTNEAFELAEKTKVITHLFNDQTGEWWFSDNPLLRVEGFTTNTFHHPMRVIPCQNIPDGWLNTSERLAMAFGSKNQRLI